MTVHRIVAVSKNPEVQQLARRVARELFVADDLREALDIIETTNPDLVILDHHFNATDIHEFLNATDKNSTNVPVVVIGSDAHSTDSSTEFVQRGAYDYLQGSKDYRQLEQIVSRIKNEPNTTDSKRELSDFFAEDYGASVCMAGRSKAILNTLKAIRLVAASHCNPILILGETGTGKELAAKAVHGLRHPDKPFVAVNCAALTANLLESELFGHVRGSFTGADREKTGLLELAGSGTLFLDEISEMPIDLQAKLLRVLQEKTFRKVGGVNNITCKATIIASSNRNLNKEIQANRFRRDLYYRLSTYPITIAPLRAPARREDVRLLAEYFLKTSTICPDKAGKITTLTELAIEALEKHDWPGNVRELRNVIDRAILLETTDKIGLSSILIEPAEWGEPSENTTLHQTKDFSLVKAERELICRALQETGWQKTQAAALLGISRATLYAKVEQYNIQKSCRTSKETRGEDAAHPLPQAAVVR
jgi:DNA-binding NtrC family response regulator